MLIPASGQPHCGFSWAVRDRMASDRSHVDRCTLTQLVSSGPGYGFETGWVKRLLVRGVEVFYDDFERIEIWDRSLAGAFHKSL